MTTRSTKTDDGRRRNINPLTPTRLRAFDSLVRDIDRNAYAVLARYVSQADLDVLRQRGMRRPRSLTKRSYRGHFGVAERHRYRLVSHVTITEPRHFLFGHRHLSRPRVYFLSPAKRAVSLRSNLKRKDPDQGAFT
jgi:hypothetical protein